MVCVFRVLSLSNFSAPGLPCAPQHGTSLSHSATASDPSGLAQLVGDTAQEHTAGQSREQLASCRVELLAWFPNELLLGSVVAAAASVCAWALLGEASCSRTCSLELIL